MIEIIPWPDKQPGEPQLWSWPHFHTDTRPGLAKLLGPHTRLYVELGTWTGASAYLACELAPSASVVCIDCWDGRGVFSNQDAIAADSLRLTQANLWDFRHRVTLLRGDTSSVVHAIGPAIGQFVDVVYIDADHTYAGAEKDIRACLQWFPQAAICGDDHDEPCGRVADDIFRHQIHLAGLYRKFWYVGRPTCPACHSQRPREEVRCGNCRYLLDGSDLDFMPPE